MGMQLIARHGAGAQLLRGGAAYEAVGGGFLAPRQDGEPGAKTIWLGLQEIAVFVEGARYARQFGEG